MLTLLEKLNEHNLIDEMGNIIIEKTELQSICIDIDTFKIFFGADVLIGDDVKHSELIGEHTFEWNGETMTKTAEELGYKKYFDEWKELGILE